MLISEQNAVVLEVWAGNLSPRICDSNRKFGVWAYDGGGSRDKGRLKVCNGISGTGPY